VSVGIVMKRAQSDAKNGYEANSVVSQFRGATWWCVGLVSVLVTASLGS
jgi:hypothetical protein